jgi:hypothetical protein
MLRKDEFKREDFQELINIKTIIVGVDFSDESKNFVKVARSLSILLGSRLLFVNVQALYPYTPILKMILGPKLFGMKTTKEQSVLFKNFMISPSPMSKPSKYYLAKLQRR